MRSALITSCSFCFRAEDGIRCHCVTGVQTCALPISSRRGRRARDPGGARGGNAGMRAYVRWLNALLDHEAIARDLLVESPLAHPSVMMRACALRSEERRVGKEGRARRALRPNSTQVM